MGNPKQLRHLGKCTADRRSVDDTLGFLNGSNISARGGQQAAAALASSKKPVYDSTYPPLQPHQRRNCYVTRPEAATGPNLIRMIPPMQTLLPAQRPAGSGLTRLKRCLKIGPRAIENCPLQQRQHQGNAPESGFAIFMVQQ